MSEYSVVTNIEIDNDEKKIIVTKKRREIIPVEIYAPGTKIVFNENIDGIIVAVRISLSGGTSYIVNYFVGLELKVIELYEPQFSTDVKKNVLGFKK